MAKLGPETWDVEGIKYTVASTYYLGLPNGLQFTMDYQAPPDFKFEGVTDDDALKVVLPIMKHAVKQRLYDRATIRDGSGKPRAVEMVGVSLFIQDGIRTHGFRVGRSVAELERLVATSAVATPPNSR